MDRVDDPEGLVADALRVQQLTDRSLAAIRNRVQTVVDELAALGAVLDPRSSGEVSLVAENDPERGLPFAASWRRTFASTGAALGLVLLSAASATLPRSAARPKAAKTRPNLGFPLTASALLAAADDELHGEAAPLDQACPRALRDHAADSP